MAFFPRGSRIRAKLCVLGRSDRRPSICSQCCPCSCCGGAATLHQTLWCVLSVLAFLPLRVQCLVCDCQPGFDWFLRVFPSICMCEIIKTKALLITCSLVSAFLCGVTSASELIPLIVSSVSALGVVSLTKISFAFSVESSFSWLCPDRCRHLRC